MTGQQPMTHRQEADLRVEMREKKIEAYLRRQNACVEACKDLPTDWLEKGGLQRLVEAAKALLAVSYREVGQDHYWSWFWMECRCGLGGPKGKPEEYLHEDGCPVPLLEKALP